MKKQILSVMLAITMLLTAFPQALVSAQEEDMAKSVDATIRLTPSAQSPFGEFEGWGTSLCWWANRLGYSETLTQQAAELFFSDNGLGLDIARYNLGGGDDPTHNHITRSDSKVPGVWETFELSEDGNDVSITYDLTNDQNQLNIAKAALAANPDLVQYKSSNPMQKSIAKLLLFLYNKKERSGAIPIGLTHPFDKLSTASYCMHSSKQVEA